MRDMLLLSHFTAFLLVATPAWAQMAAAPSAPTSTNSGTGQSIYIPTQSAAYLRANENLATQTVYLQNQITTLEGDASLFVDQNSKPTTPRDDQLAHIKQDVQGFCDSKTVATEVQQCLSDYTEAERRELEKMRGPLAQNDSAANNLQTGQGGSSLGLGSAVPQNITVVNQFQPHVPTFVDLSNAYKDIGKPTDNAPDDQNLKKPDPNAWISAVAGAPQPSDYYVTQTVPIDPTDKSKGTEDVVVLDDKGQPKVDTKAYNIAMAQWNAQQGLFVKEANTRDDKGKLTVTYADRMRADVSGKNYQNAPPTTRNPSSLAGALAGSKNPKYKPSNPLDSQAQANYETSENFVVQNFNSNDGSGGIAPPPAQITITPQKAATDAADASALKNGIVDPANPGFQEEEPSFVKAENGVETKLSPTISSPVLTTAAVGAKTPGTANESLYMPLSYIDQTINTDPQINLQTTDPNTGKVVSTSPGALTNIPVNDPGAGSQ